MYPRDDVCVLFNKIDKIGLTTKQKSQDIEEEKTCFSKEAWTELSENLVKSQHEILNQETKHAIKIYKEITDHGQTR